MNITHRNEVSHSYSHYYFTIGCDNLQKSELPCRNEATCEGGRPAGDGDRGPQVPGGGRHGQHHPEGGRPRRGRASSI